MEVELLWWAGCPSHPIVREQLRELGVPFVEREILDEADAEAQRFVGSPTLRVDGVDLFPTDDPPGLTCRIYMVEGRFSPVPGLDDLRAALCARGLPRPSTRPGT